MNPSGKKLFDRKRRELTDVGGEGTPEVITYTPAEFFLPSFLVKCSLLSYVDDTRPSATASDSLLYQTLRAPVPFGCSSKAFVPSCVLCKRMSSEGRRRFMSVDSVAS